MTRLARFCSFFALFVLAGCKPSATETKAGSLPSEQSWVISEVCTSLAQLAAYAAKSDGQLPQSQDIRVEKLPVPSGQPPRYHVVIRPPAGSPVEETLTVTDNAWTTELYIPIARKLVTQYGLKAAAGYTTQNLPLLADFGAASQVKVNNELSAYLSAHPSDTMALENAAVLLGTLAMRENSGLLWDPKLPCARAASFLALARSLESNGPKSDEAALGELLIGLIIDTKADCLNRTADLKTRAAKNPALLPWVRAAEFRNTRDWRPTLEANATQFEKVEKFRAYADGATAENAYEYFKKVGDFNAVDWNRIIFSVGGSVELGHYFSREYIQKEIKEACLTLELPWPKTSEEMKSLIAALNEIASSVVTTDPSGKHSIKAIDHGMWAQVGQRHICYAVYAIWHFMDDQWGVPDEANSFRKGMEKIFSSLEFYPLTAVLISREPSEMEPFQQRMQALFDTHPADVPDYVWSVAYKHDSALFPDLLARIKAWFDPAVPTGTAYRFGGRVSLPGFHPTREYLEKSYQIAPLQQIVAYKYYLSLYPREGNAAGLQKILGPLADYSVQQMQHLAEAAKGDPATREGVLLKLVTIDPDSYEDLGEFYIETNQPEKARDAFQAMYDKARNRVMVANNSDWLVNYYYKTGDVAKATTIAAYAAEVYSYRGLETYGKLLEKLGQLTKAEETFANIEERYDDPDPLLHFYERRAAADPASDYATKKGPYEKRLFPEGIKAVKVSDFHEPPSKGVVIIGNSATLVKNGLRPNDIIVALDGKAVADFRQYAVIRSMKETPEMGLIFFRDGKYQELIATAEGRLFGCDMGDWPRHD